MHQNIPETLKTNCVPKFVPTDLTMCAFLSNPAHLLYQLTYLLIQPLVRVHHRTLLLVL